MERSLELPAHIPSHHCFEGTYESSTSMTSSNPTYLLQAPSLNTTTGELSLQRVNLGRIQTFSAQHGETERHACFWWNVKWHSCSGKQLLKLLHTESPRHSNSIPRNLYKTAENIRPHKTCTPMFKAALFIIFKRETQQKCSSVDGQVTKMWSNHRMEY